MYEVAVMGQIVLPLVLPLLLSLSTSSLLEMSMSVSLSLSSVVVYVGVVGGLVATGAMTITELPSWKKWKLQGVLEWHENQVLTSRLLRLDEKKLHFAGIFGLHFLNGALGGLGLALAIYLIPYLSSIPLLVLGIGYGLFLWILTLVPIHKPITGISALNHPIFGKGPALASLGGHVLYGLVLGAFFLLVF